jgi:hypothetical protein
MSQQLQLGKYEFFPYYDQRNQVPEMTTEEAFKYLMARLGKSKKKGQRRKRSVEGRKARTETLDFRR